MSDKVKTSLNKSLKSRFRFVILNDSTFEELFSLVLTRINVWVFTSTLIVILVFVTASAIIYTPLKYYIPGFGDYNYRSQIINLSLQADSLEKALYAKSVKDENFIKIFTDSGLTAEPIDSKAAGAIVPDVAAKPVEPSKAELDLRKELSEQESFSINYKKDGKIDAATMLNEYHFMIPVKGIVTDEYNKDNRHFGIDIVANKDEPVKTVLDGTVISTGFDIETGYNISVQHKDNLISIYKHNAKIFKQSGDQVKAGEVIAAVGNTGSLSSGPHLHFEIWHMGKALNPKDFILF